MTTPNANDDETERNALSQMVGLTLLIQGLSPARYPTYKDVWVDVMARMTEIEEEVKRAMDRGQK